MIRVFSLLLLISSVSFAHQFSLRLNEEQINPKLVPPLNYFLSQIEILLPEKMKVKINRPITVEFSKMGTSELSPPKCVDQNKISKIIQESLTSHTSPNEELNKVFQDFGVRNENGIVASDNKIKINKYFISEIVKGPSSSKTYDCGHKSMYRLALATVIHEIGHLYDSSSQSWFTTLVSSDSRYQRLAGWSKKWSLSWGLLKQVLKPKGQLFLRSPDTYEYEDIRENFAENLEFFLLDPEYECRRPAMYGYFQSHFGDFRPHPKCQPNTRVNTHDQGGGIKKDSIYDLNPDRIYEVHYLIASRGKAQSSRFGHSMLRLIGCDPKREQVDAECLKDLKYHIVISYNAYIEDGRESSWKGITGKYPSKPLIFPLQEVVDYYTKMQSRDISSFPIKLTSREKNQLIYKILEQYWEYTGKYYFFTNNCSTEIGHLLKGVLETSCLHGFSAKTPVQLKDRLKGCGLLDEGLLEHKKIARENGYFFQSNQEIIQNSFNLIKSTMFELQHLDKFQWTSPESYIFDSDPLQRKEIAAILEDNVGSSLKSELINKEQAKKLFSGLYYLESLIELKLDKLLGYNAFMALEQSAQESHENQTSDQDYQVYQFVIERMRAALYAPQLNRGYGVPVSDDYVKEPNLAAKQEEQTKPNDQSPDLINSWIERNFKKELDELNLISENKKVMMKKIRSYL